MRLFCKKYTANMLENLEKFLVADETIAQQLLEFGTDANTAHNLQSAPAAV